MDSPPLLRALAARALLSALLYAGLGAAFIIFEVWDGEGGLNLVAAAVPAIPLGLLAARRVRAARGLKRLTALGRRLEAGAGWAWIVLGGGYASILLLDGEWGGAAISGAVALSSAAAVVYLRRARIRQLFAGETRRFGVTRAAASTLVLLVAAMASTALYLNGHSSARRAHVKRTMSEMRTLATAIEAWSVDASAKEALYPEADSIEALAKVLEPDYLRQVPKDGWGRPFRYLRVVGAKGQQSYYLASAGRDGKWEKADLSTHSPGTTSSPDEDIVFSDGKFVRVPP